jgi:hypothetical protein
MCIAIAQKAGHEISTERLRTCARHNADGAGYAFVLDTPTGPTVKIVKSLKWSNIEKQYRRDWHRHGHNTPFLIHFRIASHGSVAFENCHPFPSQGGSAMIHNGMLPMYAGERDQSDTARFARLVSQLPNDWADDWEWPTILQEAVGRQNKVAWLFPDRRVLILNESAGVKDGENWYSNSSFQPRTQNAWPSNPTQAVTTSTAGSKPNPKDLVDDGLYDDKRRKTWNSAAQRWDIKPEYSVTMPLSNQSKSIYDEDDEDGSQCLLPETTSASETKPASTPSGSPTSTSLATTLPVDRVARNIIDRNAPFRRPSTPLQRFPQDRVEMQRANGEVLSSPVEMMKIANTGITAVARDHGIWCVECGEDLSTAYARLHHDKAECQAEKVEQLMRINKGGRVAGSAQGSKPVKYAGGRTIVQYPGV